MYDAVFDETNGFQVEQCDLNDVDDEDAPCDALRTMAIGDMRPQESIKINLLQMKLLLLPKQMIKIKKNGQDKDDDQDQDVGNDQGGVEQDEDDNDQEESRL
jgi:hypothetical protein